MDILCPTKYVPTKNSIRTYMIFSGSDIGTRTVDDTREAKSKVKVVYTSHCPSVHGLTSMGSITKLIKEDVGMASQKVKKQGRDERNEEPVGVSSMLE